MIYSNKTVEDILVREDLDRLASMNTNLKIFHTITRHDDAKHGVWTGIKGRVCEAILKECGFPEPSPDTLICMCGPMAFNKACEQALTNLGYGKDMIHKF